MADGTKANGRFGVHRPRERVVSVRSDELGAAADLRGGPVVQGAWVSETRTRAYTNPDGTEASAAG
jgi:hypothetical protein